jgi:hypothetical protein
LILKRFIESFSGSTLHHEWLPNPTVRSILEKVPQVWVGEFSSEFSRSLPEVDLCGRILVLRVSFSGPRKGKSHSEHDPVSMAGGQVFAIGVRSILILIVENCEAVS